MKKLFTLMTTVLMGMAVHAQTLVNYEKNLGTFTGFGTTVVASSVKIHTNTKTVSGIEFPNSYFSEGALGANYATVACEGGFKAGDVVTIAGAYNNKEEKVAAIDIFTVAEDQSYTVLFSTQEFINGQLVDDDPVVETFTLEEDVDVLYFGRNGKTKTFVTTFKIVRGEETPEEPEPEPEVEEGVILDAIQVVEYAGEEYVDKFGFVEYVGNCTADAVNINGNKVNVPCIKFSSSYKSDNALNTYAIVKPNIEGGFKAGDEVSLAGVFNNSDDSKETAVVLFTIKDASTLEEGANPVNLLYTTATFINGRNVAEDPEVETYVLEEDTEELCLGRQGNTATCLTTLIVKRDEVAIADPSSISFVNVQNKGVAYNLAGQQVSSSYKGIVIENGKKTIRK